MFLNYPNIKSDKQFIFYSTSAANKTTTNDQSRITWTKPQGIAFVHIIAIGAGGGGGNGISGASGTNRNGGGGGGPGAIVTGFYPAYLLPDSLTINVGVGGANNTAGSNTLITIDPKYGYSVNSSNSQSVRFILAAGGNNGGSTGTTSNGGVSGVSTDHSASLGASTISLIIPTFSFTKSSTPANIGGAGGNNTPSFVAGANVTQTGTTSQILLGGAGGGACNSSNQTKPGGSVTSVGFLVANGGDNGSPGDDGYYQWKPLSFCGGAGGGANPTGTGGKGGDGAYGCGGGGGGAGVTGGAGGKGGDGLVIINCW